jgi:hypothetical protein
MCKVLYFTLEEAEKSGALDAAVDMLVFEKAPVLSRRVIVRPSRVRKSW